MSNLNLSFPLFPELPSEVNSIILKNVILDQPTIITSGKIKDYANKINNIASINKTTFEVLSEKMKDLKRIRELVNKYTIYNRDYEQYGEEDGDVNPHLLDAVLTGWNLPFGDHSIQEYTQETENDIKDIVRLTPQSLNCKHGYTRMCQKVTPLFAACLNYKYHAPRPLSIIEFLLKSGADMNAKIDSGKYGSAISIARMIKSDEFDTDRGHAIRELFKKYEFEKI